MILMMPTMDSLFSTTKFGSNKEFLNDFLKD